VTTIRLIQQDTSYMKNPQIKETMNIPEYMVRLKAICLIDLPALTVASVAEVVVLFSIPKSVRRPRDAL
jgi:hypothetical protein